MTDPDRAADSAAMQPFSHAACELGEGPHASAPLRRVFWFDVPARRLYEQGYDGRGFRVHALPFVASAMATVDADRQLLVAEDGLYLREVGSGRLHRHRALEAERGDTRSNDARTHPCGALWIGTMGRDAQPGAGSVYWYRAGELRRLYAGLGIPNSIAFSADGRAAWLSDTADGVIWRIPTDPASGLPAGDRRVFHRAGRHDGGPDGAVVDIDGVLWSARFGAGRVDGFAPDGTRLRSLPVPAAQPTCPAFVGEDADRLLVTSAWEGLDAAQRARDPQAGRSFVLPQAVRGRFDAPVRLA